jgi:hypothetical protein
VGSSNSQTPVTQQTQQTRDPWAPAQPYLQQAMGAAASNFNADVGYQPYPGTHQVDLNPTMQSALTGMSNLAYSNLGGTPGVNAARSLGTNLIQNEGLSGRLKSLYEQAQGDENPYLQNILNTSNRQISDKIGSSMSGAGRYGSGQHTDVAARAMAEAADPILAQDYARRQQQMQGIAEGGLQRAGQWAQNMPMLDEARYAPAERLMALGQYQQERSQSALNDYIKLYETAQARPWEQLARFNAIVGGAGALGGTMTGSTSTPINSPSTLQKILGGGLAGAGIGGSFGGPPGAAVGALGGGLLGMM